MKSLWFKFRLWLAKERIVVEPIDNESELVIHSKIVDAKVYIVKEYRRYKTLEAYQRELIKRTIPKLRDHLNMRGIL